MTQAEMIYEHLAAGGTLTPLEALQRFGCLALSQRCGELRRQGVPIESELVAVGTDGRKRVARYRLSGIAYG